MHWHASMIIYDMTNLDNMDRTDDGSMTHEV